MMMTGVKIAGDCIRSDAHRLPQARLVLAARKIEAARAQLDHQHHRAAHEQARDDFAEKQRADRDFGQVAIYDKGNARRDDRPDRAGGAGERGGEAGAVTLLFIAAISITPSPAASATAEPDIPAKIMLPSTLTWARPPRARPTSSCVKSKMRCVIPPVLIRLPAKMKNGTASSGNNVVAE